MTWNRIQRAIDRAPIAAVIALALVFATFILQKGVPVLRHDWNWPVGTDEFRANLIDSASGWSTYGIGSLHPYPTDYLVDAVFYGLSFVLSPGEILFILAWGTGIVVGAGAFQISKVGGTKPLAWTLGAVLFALFNPWTYTEAVAGHLLMITALGGVLLLAGLVLRSERTHPATLSLCLALVFQQMQFFVVTLAIFVGVFVRRRAFLPAVTAFLLSLPIVVGIAGGFHDLAAIPYTLTWQQTQSVGFGNAFLLSGYFTGYSDSLDPLARFSVVGVAVLALASAWDGLRCGYWIRCALALVGLCVFASGTKGPIGSLYTNLVLSVPGSGLFRELYDLLGFAVCCYLILLTKAPWIRTTSVLFCSCGIALLVSWAAAPPSRYWIGQSQLPAIRLQAALGSRYALFPAFQPLTLSAGGGSGADPDARLRKNAITPLNEYLPTYPSVMALGEFSQYRDSRALRALGVSYVVCRSFLRSQGDALRALTKTDAPHDRCRSGPIRAMPQAALSAYPKVEWRVPALDDDAVLFSDASTATGDDVPRNWGLLPRSFSFAASRNAVDARTGWIDARFVFGQVPALAQPYGGVFTTNSVRGWPVQSSAWILASVNGTLFDFRQRIIYRGSTLRYRWIHVRPGNLYCAGMCLLAAGTHIRPPHELASHTAVWHGIHERQLLPWLASVTLPAGGAELLRYNTRFDRAWVLSRPRLAAAHLPIDGVINGWLLHPRSQAVTVFIFHKTAMIQALLEGLAVLWIAAVFLIRYISDAKSFYREHETTSR